MTVNLADMQLGTTIFFFLCLKASQEIMDGRSKIKRGIQIILKKN